MSRLRTRRLATHEVRLVAMERSYALEGFAVGVERAADAGRFDLDTGAAAASKIADAARRVAGEYLSASHSRLRGGARCG